GTKRRAIRPDALPFDAHALGDRRVGDGLRAPLLEFRHKRTYDLSAAARHAHCRGVRQPSARFFPESALKRQILASEIAGSSSIAIPSWGLAHPRAVLRQTSTLAPILLVIQGSRSAADAVCSCASVMFVTGSC